MVVAMAKRNGNNGQGQTLSTACGYEPVSTTSSTLDEKKRGKSEPKEVSSQEDRYSTGSTPWASMCRPSLAGSRFENCHKYTCSMKDLYVSILLPVTDVCYAVLAIKAVSLLAAAWRTATSAAACHAPQCAVPVLLAVALRTATSTPAARCLSASFQEAALQAAAL